MNLIIDGHWFAVEPATAPAAAAGAAMLARRTALIVERLPAAAHHPAADGTDVHQLRVGCRRAAAALRAFAPLVPREAKKLGRWFKRIRRAAGPARDADVLIARYRREYGIATPLARQGLDLIESDRDAAQDALEKVCRREERGGLDRAAEACRQALEQVARSRKAVDFATFGRAAIAEAIEPVGQFVASDAAVAELHALRIAAKRLRYSLELFQSALPDGVARDAYPQVEEIQERLGAVNDRVAAQTRFQGWLAEMPADAEAAFVAGLVQAEWSSADRLRGEFLDWWTDERRRALVEKLTAAVE